MCSSLLVKQKQLWSRRTMKTYICENVSVKISNLVFYAQSTITVVSGWFQLRTRAVSKSSYKVPGEIKRSRDHRGGRWSWTFKFAQKRSWVGRWSWAEQVGPLLLRIVQVVRQQQCNGHCLCDSVQAQQLKQQSRSVQVAGQWRGDTALTLPLFWRRSTVSPVFFERFPRSSLHSVVPFPLCPRP